MKKLILMMFTALIAVSASAQELERSKFFDNTFVGVSTGVGAWLKPTNNGFADFGGSIHSVSTARVGKWFTPNVGGQLFYEFGVDSKELSVNGNNSHLLGADFLVNFSNLVGGYKGEPRRVEFVPFIGGGWHRVHGVGFDNIAAHTGLQIDFNMGKKKAWQINVIPNITYILTDEGFSNIPTSQPRFDVNRSYVTLQAGLTYKFKTSNGTHNFKLSDKQFTQADLDVYLNENDALKKGLNTARNNELALKEKNAALVNDNARLQKDLEEALKKLANVKVQPTTNTVGFKIGQSKILPQNRATLLTIANQLNENSNAKVLVTGYADAKTGTAKRNMEISKLRAEAVKAELVALGVDASRIVVDAKGDTVQPFAENDANRVAISIVE